MALLLLCCHLHCTRLRGTPLWRAVLFLRGYPQCCFLDPELWDCSEQCFLLGGDENINPDFMRHCILGTQPETPLIGNLPCSFENDEGHPVVSAFDTNGETGLGAHKTGKSSYGFRHVECHRGSFVPFRCICWSDRPCSSTFKPHLQGKRSLVPPSLLRCPLQVLPPEGFLEASAPRPGRCSKQEGLGLSKQFWCEGKYNCFPKSHSQQADLS